MKKTISPFFLTALLLMAVTAYAQPASPYNEETLVIVQSYARTAEMKRLTDLTPEQEQRYSAACKQYFTSMYRAAHVETHLEKAAQIMREAKKTLDLAWMDILTEKQQRQYIRAMMADEVHQETMLKIASLQNSGKYNKEEADKFYKQIYNYYMSVKIISVRYQYDIKKLRKNLSTLRKIAPKVIKESNTPNKAEAKP